MTKESLSLMYIAGQRINRDELIYYDASNGEMLDIRTISVGDLLDRGFHTWKQHMSKVSMNLKEEDYIMEWMYLNRGTFIPYL